MTATRTGVLRASGVLLVTWQRALVLVSFIAGSVICAVNNSDVIAASLAAAAAGAMFPGQEKPPQ